MQALIRQGLLERLGPISAMNAQHLRVWGLALIATGQTLATQADKLTKQDLKSIEEALLTAGRGIRLAGSAV